MYELAVENWIAEDISGQRSSDNDQPKKPTFILKRMACFGSPRFDGKKALHILSADSRFPDIQPGQQMAAGNHFLSVFPDIKRRKRIRGGAGNMEEEDSIFEENFERPLLTSRLFWWWLDLMQCIGI